MLYGPLLRAVKHKMLLHLVRQWLKKNMNYKLYSQTEPHIAPLRANYVVSIVKIFDKMTAS